MKKLISILLSVCLALALAACGDKADTAGPTEQPGQDTQNTTIQNDVQEKAWSEQEIRTLFAAKAKSNWTMVSCVTVSDLAYDYVGAVLFTDSDPAYIRVAFMDAEGHMQSSGVQASLDDTPEFTYCGNGAVTFKVRTAEGVVYTQKFTISITDNGVNFISESI